MSKKVKIEIALGALVLLFAVALLVRHSRHHIPDLPEILESGRLSVLTHNSTMGFSLKGDSVSGFQYEIVKAFADTLGVELVVTEQNDLKDCIEGLQSGDYNIIANFMPVTTEWQKDVSFTTPILTSRQVLVQRITNDSIKPIAITKLIQLAKDTVSVSANSPFKMILKHLSDQIADTIYVPEKQNKSTEQMVQLVAEGKIKYTICDEKYAQRFKLLYPNIDVSIPIGFSQNLAWAVHPKSPKLLQELNDFLDDFIGSSAYWEIYRKYY